MDPYGKAILAIVGILLGFLLSSIACAFCVEKDEPKSRRQTRGRPRQRRVLAVSSERRRSRCQRTLNFLTSEWELDEESLWYKFLKKAKLQGIKDAMANGRSGFGRIAWGLVTLVCTVFGTIWLVNLIIDINEKPTTDGFMEKKIRIDHVPFPAFEIGKRNNFKLSKIQEMKSFQEITKENGYGEDINGNTWNTAELQKLGLIMDQMCMPMGQETRWLSHETIFNKYWNTKKISGWTNDYVYDTANSSVALKMIPIINEANVKCKDIFKTCKFGEDDVDCRKFSDVQTDMGGACAFNNIPPQALRKVESIYTLLSKGETCKEDVDSWKKFNLDTNMINPTERAANCSTPYQKNLTLTQPEGGLQFGLGFVAEWDDDQDAACLQNEGEGYLLNIRAPFTEGSMKSQGIRIPFNHDVEIILEPVLTLGDDDIKGFTEEKRHCTFQRDDPEGQLKYYQYYTESNCKKEALSDAIIKKCGCALFSMPNNGSVSLCTTIKETKCARKLESKGVKAAECIPGCGDLEYRVVRTSVISYTKDTAPAAVRSVTTKSRTSRVQIAFSDDHVAVRYKKKRYSFFELVGEIGGTIGMTNGFSFLDGFRLADSLIIIFGLWIGKLIHKCFPQWKSSRKVSDSTIVKPKRKRAPIRSRAPSRRRRATPKGVGKDDQGRSKPEGAGESSSWETIEEETDPPISEDDDRLVEVVIVNPKITPPPPKRSMYPSSSSDSDDEGQPQNSRNEDPGNDPNNEVKPKDVPNLEKNESMEDEVKPPITTPPEENPTTSDHDDDKNRFRQKAISQDSNEDKVVDDSNDEPSPTEIPEKNEQLEGDELIEVQPPTDPPPEEEPPIPSSSTGSQDEKGKDNEQSPSRASRLAVKCFGKVASSSSKRTKTGWPSSRKVLAVSGTLPPASSSMPPVGEPELEMSTPSAIVLDKVMRSMEAKPRPGSANTREEVNKKKYKKRLKEIEKYYTFS